MRRCLILLSLAAAGCAPVIERFDAAPPAICPGDMATLTWRATGSSHNEASLIIDAASAVANQRTVAAEGSLQVSPDRRILYRLIASNDQGGVSADTSVDMLAPADRPLRFPFERAFSCDHGFPTVVEFAPPAVASGRLRVASIASRPDAGINIVQVSGPLPGEAVGRPWLLTLDHLNRPVCPPPGRVREGPPPPPPRILVFEVTAVCG